MDNILEFNISFIPQCTCLINLLFDTIIQICNQNSENQELASNYLNLIQEYIQNDKFCDLLIAIFKDENFEIQNEIHNEVMYKEVYECEKFPEIISFFIDMYIKDPHEKYLYILWKLCVIENNPLPIN